MHENHAREYLQQVFGENWCEYFTRCVLSSKNGGTTSWNQYTVTCTSKPSLAHFLHGRLSFLVACGCKLDKLNCGSTHSSLLKVQVWVKFQKRVWFLDYYPLLVKVDSTFFCSAPLCLLLLGVEQILGIFVPHIYLGSYRSHCSSGNCN